MSDNERYVVIEYTKASGGWAGNRYITGLGGQDLDSLRERLGDRERVIADDVSMDEAQRIVAQVPVEARVNAAFEEATVGGELQPMMLKMHLMNSAAAAGHDAMVAGKHPGMVEFEYRMAVSKKVEAIEDFHQRLAVMRLLL